MQSDVTADRRTFEDRKATLLGAVYENGNPAVRAMLLDEVADAETALAALYPSDLAAPIVAAAGLLRLFAEVERGLMVAGLLSIGDRLALGEQADPVALTTVETLQEYGGVVAGWRTGGCCFRADQLVRIHRQDQRDIRDLAVELGATDVEVVLWERVARISDRWLRASLLEEICEQVAGRAGDRAIEDLVRLAYAERDPWDWADIPAPIVGQDSASRS